MAKYIPVRQYLREDQYDSYEVVDSLFEGYITVEQACDLVEEGLVDHYELAEALTEYGIEPIYEVNIRDTLTAAGSGIKSGLKKAYRAGRKAYRVGRNIERKAKDNFQAGMYGLGEYGIQQSLNAYDRAQRERDTGHPNQARIEKHKKASDRWNRHSVAIADAQDRMYANRRALKNAKDKVKFAKKYGTHYERMD